MGFEGPSVLPESHLGGEKTSSGWCWTLWDKNMFLFGWTLLMPPHLFVRRFEVRTVIDLVLCLFVFVENHMT